MFPRVPACGKVKFSAIAANQIEGFSRLELETGPGCPKRLISAPPIIVNSSRAENGLQNGLMSIIWRTIFVLFLGRTAVLGGQTVPALATDCPKVWFVAGPAGRCYLTLPAARIDLQPLRADLEGSGPYAEGLDPGAIDLGRYLFFDPLLSRDRSLSCAHCHHPQEGFADGLGQARGRGAIGAGYLRRGGVRLARSTPSLWNTGLKHHWFWDGRAITLEEQALMPLFAPNEMAMTPPELVARLAQNPTYRQWFQRVYGGKLGAVTVSQVSHALVTFERSLISLDSAYDRYMNGDKGAITKAELGGLDVFRSFVSRCPECHTPPLMTNGALVIIGAPDRDKSIDQGAGPILGEPRLNGAFRVPSLRNIAQTAPYMHSGVFRTLRAVLAFYNSGAGRGPLGTQNPNTHWHMRPMGLSSQEQEAVVAFLDTLTDDRHPPLVPQNVPSGQPVLQ